MADRTVEYQPLALVFPSLSLMGGAWNTHLCGNSDGLSHDMSVDIINVLSKDSGETLRRT